MKLNFKIQNYQTEAVNSIVNVFNGQSKSNASLYVRDLGKVAVGSFQTETDDTGFKNANIELTDKELLENLHTVQKENNINLAEHLEQDLGRVQLDVEMETGTGKTYVYIKTMFELNKQYGWSKFIIVVPSIPIREGVAKTFQITQDHFMSLYGKKARYFIYDSSRLTDIDNFSKDGNINVMIINIGAFNKDFEKDDKANIIFRRQDSFQSRRPIDVIAANAPILILDEPQKMGKKGSQTQKALQKFNPLFSLYYSATHTEKHNQTYVLDAVDAYNKKLVKKIQVKGISVQNLPGKDGYLFFQNVELSKGAPQARVEMEIKTKSSITRVVKLLKKGDNLEQISGLKEYKHYIVSDINAIDKTLTFINGVCLVAGNVVGDVAEKDLRRVQIQETIRSHFKKEEDLFKKNIKTLSLFFIDEVAKYRKYDANGIEELGEYGKIFENEYKNILNEQLELLNADSEYRKYLLRDDVKKIHNGYFSIDKKGQCIDSTIKKGTDVSDDVSAYDLILKNKEKLLDLKTPTRFIFSHSALREGWDNPNVFQICTLKKSDNTNSKRQEVGRGMRLCVNQQGERQDYETLGDDVQNVNMLTVIANESYEDFARGLQSEMADVLYNRPQGASASYFLGKTVTSGNDGSKQQIDDLQASLIMAYLQANNYIETTPIDPKAKDKSYRLTPTYYTAKQNGTLAPIEKLFPTLQPIQEDIHKLINGIFDPKVLREMCENGNKTEGELKLTDNFKKREFQELWKRINHKYAYTCQFDSEELIEKSVASINTELNIAKLRYTITEGIQKDELSKEHIEQGVSFTEENKTSKTLQNAELSGIRYDLIGDIAKACKLTRKTIFTILSQISNEKRMMFARNPEEFIRKVSELILAQKATMIVEHITYTQTDESPYDSEIFTAEKHGDFSKAIMAKKHVTNYLFTDGIAKDGQSTEYNFAKSLEEANEVCVYAKLPKAFHIPTPVGNYSPDWAIAFNEGLVKHIYFVAETKGSMDSLQLRAIENAKISCARKLFEKISNAEVKYNHVTTYEDLLDLVCN